MASVNLESDATIGLDPDGKSAIPTDPDSPRQAASGLAPRFRQILRIALIQYGVVGVCLAWGWGLARIRGIVRPAWIDHLDWTQSLWPCLGVAGMLLLIADGLRFSSPARHGPGRKGVSRICLGLGISVGIIMAFEMIGGNDEEGLSLAFSTLLLTPFLLAIGPLVRATAFLGLVGSVLFLIAAFAILTYNGMGSSGVGFFHNGEVS